MAKQILRNTEGITAVKVWGAGSTETISLDTDLVVTNRLVRNTADPVVNILSYTWAGEKDSLIKVSRGTTDIIAISADNPGQIIFDDMMYVDSVAPDEDIKVTITGDAYLYVVLRKSKGYSNTFEPGYYGVYDDPTIVGPKAPEEEE